MTTSNVLRPTPPTKEKMLGVARNLMIKKGYIATSIDEICTEAGYTKGAFFYYFKSKEDLGKALLEHHRNMMGGLLENAPFMQLDDPLERIKAYINFIIEIYQDPVTDSCLVGMFTEELADTHPDIRILCKQIFSDWTVSLGFMLKEAKNKYAPDSMVDCEELAEHLIAVFEGAVILAKAKKSVLPISKNLNLYKEFIGNIFQ